MSQGGELGSDKQRALKGMMKGSGSMTKLWEADSGIKPESDVIVFSFLKEEHSGDGLNPCKEKIQSRRGSEVVSCLSRSSFCNYLLSLITWTNAMSTTVFPSQQSHFAVREATEGVLPRAGRVNIPHLCLNGLHGGFTGEVLGHRGQAQGGVTCGRVKIPRAICEPWAHGTTPEVFEQGPTTQFKSS